MTMKNIQKDLAVKIQEEYRLGEINAQSKAAEILDRCPVQLRSNVYEWTEGRPLSDIFIEKYSIPMILSIWRSNDFLGALEVITELSQGDMDKAERQIWRMRR